MEQKSKRRGSLFTSECVTVGHPDKLCDYISDTIVTEILKADPNARVAVEAMASQGMLVLAGEVTTVANVDYEQLARKAIKEVGYNYSGYGFSADDVEVIVNIHSQSPDIAQGVDNGGAGDQGLMFGGAWRETQDLMPLPITLARGMAVRLTELANENSPEQVGIDGNCIFPDGKTQVTVVYGKGHVPMAIDTVVVSIACGKNTTQKDIESVVKSYVIEPVLEENGFHLNEVNKIFINPTGKFEQHGPAADVGLTGRKIIVDTYGGYCPHGGGAFSGKDPSKVDRSAAYMARYIAKNIVAAGIAERCEIQLAYAIGVSKPVSVNLNMFNTNTYPIGLVSKAVYNVFDMTPRGIERTLGLRDGIDYAKLSITGHFGENGDVQVPWERTDKSQELLMFCEEHLFTNNNKVGERKEFRRPKK